MISVIRRGVWLAALVTAGWQAGTAVPVTAVPVSDFVWHLPAGSPIPRVPQGNPMSVAKVDLGRRLFYDTRLSGNQTYACASCHQQARAFTDGLDHAVGSTGARHARSAMSLTNVAYNATFGWADDTIRSLEDQMAVPMFNEHPIELGMTGRDGAILARFDPPADRARFQAAFPETATPISLGHIVKAIASFERTLIAGNTALDRYLYRDDRAALSPSAQRGMTLFFSTRLRCSECHAGFNLSGATTFEGGDAPDVVFHNVGLYNEDGRGAYPAIDQGLFAVSRRAQDMGRFRAPTLRNIAVTAPYMHDGSLPTLDAVLTHYSHAGVDGPLRSDRIKGFTLDDTERQDLVAFLNSLTDRTFLTNPDFGPPRN
ncbi:MAG: MbnH family di-heme enzyme [Acidobacteriota bacterium]